MWGGGWVGQGWPAPPPMWGGWVGWPGLASPPPPPHRGPGSLSNSLLVVEHWGDLKIALRGGGGGLEKWGSVSGPLFCVRTDVGAEGAGTQNFGPKKFFPPIIPPPPPTFE